MGLDIQKEHFSAADYAAFSERLYLCLDALKYQIRTPSFGDSPLRIGAELENYIVDHHGIVMPINREIIARGQRQEYTVELNKFNLEINFQPLDLNAKVFTTLSEQMHKHFAELGAIAEGYDANIIPIGILPTLQATDLTAANMTDTARYRVLAKYLADTRGDDFEISIHGEEDLQLRTQHVAYEGANTSLQFHLMVPHSSFSAMFNATQMVTPLLIAVAANSPMLLQKKLWHETRIALFKQSIDNRVSNPNDWKQPARVSFGQGWVREDAWELFAEHVALYPPIFPIMSPKSPAQSVEQGQIPSLEELNLHMSTTWAWNRPIYCHQDNGHVRIEMRALPAGPSIIDMCANAAFATGLVFGLQNNIAELLALMPFKFAERNFYRAAQQGLNAAVIWTDTRKHQLVELPVTEVLHAMLPIAQSGLNKIGIDKADARFYLGVIEKRLEKHCNGALWQRQQLAQCEETTSRSEACQHMVKLYMDYFRSGLPVHDWKIH